MTEYTSFSRKMVAAGFVECFRLFHDSEIQTWYKKRPGPYQLDHLFCDSEFARGIRSCTVAVQPALDGLSDHAMLVLESEPA